MGEVTKLRRTRIVPLVVGLALSAACGSDLVADEPFGFGGAETGSGGGNASNASNSSDGDEDNGDDDDDDDDDDGTDDGANAEGDAGDDGTGAGDGSDEGGTGEPEALACDVYGQDCPAGEKCTLYANDGGVFPNDVQCVALTGEGQAGDSCTTSLTSDGLDDCDVGLFCQVDDPTTDTGGYCSPYCVGFSGNGNCEDPSLECALLYGGVAPLCLAACTSDDECPTGQTCAPQMIGDAVCVGDAWGA